MSANGTFDLVRWGNGYTDVMVDCKAVGHYFAIRLFGSYPKLDRFAAEPRRLVTRADAEVIAAGLAADGFGS